MIEGELTKMKRERASVRKDEKQLYLIQEGVIGTIEILYQVMVADWKEFIDHIG